MNNESLQTNVSTQQQTPGSSSNVSPSNETQVVCEDGVCYRKPSESEPSNTPSPTETEQEKQDKIKKAMKLIEEKRIERVKEEKRLEVEREIQRRQEGQKIVDLKKWKEDQEMEQIKQERLKDKQDAKAARQRVLDQIEEDKKERASRFGASAEAKAAPNTQPVTKPTPQASNTSRIQFKKPDGETEVITFDCDMLFADLHAFVKADILHGSVIDFTLAMSFPRREFSQDDFDKTLTQLSLTPSAVLLIIVGKKPSTYSPGNKSTGNVLPTQTDGRLTSMLYALFVGLFSPVVALFGYMKNYFTKPPVAGESANEAGKRKRNEELLIANDA